MASLAGALLACASAVSAAAQAPASTSASSPADKAPDKSKARGVRIIRPDTPSEAAKPKPSTAPVPSPARIAPGSAIAPKPAPPAPARLTAPVIKPCPRPFATPDLALGATPRFEKALRTRLAARRGRVVVDLAQPYAAGADAPAALAPWLEEVKASGGIVSVDQYCRRGRGAFGNFLKTLLGGASRNPYKAARSYDAVLHADALDMVVTQVEFVPRAALN